LAGLGAFQLTIAAWHASYYHCRAARRLRLRRTFLMGTAAHGGCLPFSTSRVAGALLRRRTSRFLAPARHCAPLRYGASDDGERRTRMAVGDMAGRAFHAYHRRGISRAALRRGRARAPPGYLRLSPSLFTTTCFLRCAPVPGKPLPPLRAISPSADISTAEEQRASISCVAGAKDARCVTHLLRRRSAATGRHRAFILTRTKRHTPGATPKRGV